MTEQSLQQAFVLHARPYRNTSLLVDVITPQQGRHCVIAKGARRHKSSFRGLLQPFSPLLISWVGQHELGVLTDVEARGMPFYLQGDSLLSGFYVNELLMRLIQRHDSCENIFTHYQSLLSQLAKGEQAEPLLRHFEKHLLEMLGFSVSFLHEVETGAEISVDGFYRYLHEQGFKQVQAQKADAKQGVYSGDCLLALHHEIALSQSQLLQAKILMRNLFAPLLGYKPLKSRELFY